MAAALLARLMPDEPEVLGLLVLIRLHRARDAARFDTRGRLVLLRDQDRSVCDRGAISAGRPAEARRADEHALALTSNAAERSLIEQRLS